MKVGVELFDIHDGVLMPANKASQLLLEPLKFRVIVTEPGLPGDQATDVLAQEINGLSLTLP